MCEVCTEAVHSVALGTRVTLQVWTCVMYVPKQSIPQNRKMITNLGMYLERKNASNVCYQAQNVGFWIEKASNVCCQAQIFVKIA